jgi:hypothetical protein
VLDAAVDAQRDLVLLGHRVEADPLRDQRKSLRSDRKRVQNCS